VACSRDVTRNLSCRRLDIFPKRVQIPDGVMKSRITTSVVCLLYLSVALVFGVLHEHHDHDSCPDGDHKDCAACQWQLNAITDVPTVVPLILGCVLETPHQVFEVVSYSAPSFSFSPSRAPPVALA
jgi:hypothetical protein